MAKETATCPMCGTKLKMMNGQMTCKKCGYYVRNQNEQSSYQGTGSYSSGQQSGSTSSGGYTSGKQSSSGSASWQSGSVSSGSTSRQSGYQNSSGYTPPKSSGNTNPAVAIVTAVSLSVVCLAALVGIILFRIGAFDNLFPNSNSRGGSSASHKEESSSGTSQSASQESGNRESGTGTSSALLPKSDFFRQVAEAIWEKPYQDITAGEYASLTALQINRDDKAIYYQVSHGDTQSLTYQTDFGMELSDLSCFTGLEWLSIDDDLKKGDLKGLDYLYGVYAENTFKDLAGIIPHPEYITDLGVSDSIFERNLDGIESFPNLLYLYLEYDSVEDISVLSQFPGLLGLSLMDCDKLNDYSPLMTLTNLEELSIQSTQLKSIDFIKQMPNLVSFSIEDTKVSSLSALESCPGLTYLALADNTEIADYSVVGQLTQLTELELELNYGGTLPSFANMPQLQWLTIKYAGDLTPLKDAANVTYLSMERCSGWELDAITSMQALTTLVIKDFSSYVDSLEPLTRLPNLAVLNLDDTSVFGNVEEIFGIPTLCYLYLDDCQIGLDFDNIPDNETLQILSMNDLTILNDPTYNNGDKANLAEHCDMFAHFPNLTDLYVESQKLDNIDFVEMLPRLQYLDITDNNVTSLKPLESLNDFQAVWCGQNTILENLPEDSPISVYTSDN